MKRLIFLIPLLVVLVKSNAQDFAKAKTIQDYFNLIRTESTYEISHCNWLNENRFKKIVDISNGFIAFTLLEEKEPVLQMALFKDNKQEDLIVIHLKKYVCADYFACAETDGIQTYFLKYEAESWVNVSDEVLPQVPVNYFYEDSTNAKIVNTYAPYAIAYELPRFGHIVSLKLEICDGYINYDEVEPTISDEQIDELLKARKSRLLKWDKRVGRFQLAE